MTVSMCWWKLLLFRSKQEKRKGRSVDVRAGTLNLGSMSVKGREIPDLRTKRKVDIFMDEWKKDMKRVGVLFFIL